MACDQRAAPQGSAVSKWAMSAADFLRDSRKYWRPFLNLGWKRASPEGQSSAGQGGQGDGAGAVQIIYS